MFVMRDPRGIRPCHMLVTDEVIAFASERVPLMTVFEADAEEVKAVDPGSMITIKSDGTMTDTAFAPPQQFTPCSFEKIYFSRGNDPQIYRERKAMGAALVPQVVDSIGGAFEKTSLLVHPEHRGDRLSRNDGRLAPVSAARRSAPRSWKPSERGNLTPELVDDLILRNWPQGEKGGPQGHQDADLHLPGKGPRPDGFPRL